MFRYSIFVLIVLIPVIIICLRLLPKKVSRRAILKTGIILLLLTAIFDSMIVGLGIVSYNPQYILGIAIGFAPIEDFAYTVAAVLIMVTMWERRDLL